MALTLHWFLPTSGDSRSLVGAGQGVPRDAAGLRESVDGPGAFREPSIDYLADVARTAERLGFTGALTPTGTFCEDAWLVTAALLRETTRLKFLVAFRPGVINPVLAAQMAAAYQRISGGRLMLNIVTGGEPREQAPVRRHRPQGRALRPHRGVPGRAARHLGAGAVRLRRPVLLGRGGDGERRHRAAGRLLRRLVRGGRPVAARHADVYLTWGEPLDQVREKIDWIRGLAAAQGRQLRFGLRIHTLSRDTSEEAWAHAQWLLDGLDRDTVARAQAALGASESTGQQRMLALRRGGDQTAYADARELEVAPNLWSGVGLVRGGAGTALVGSHEEVADRLAEYHALGIDEVILSGYPHVEEAYRFAEGVTPVLRARGLLDESATDDRRASAVA